MISPNLRQQIEEACSQELRAAAGAQRKPDRSAIVKRFAGKGVSRATIYRMLKGLAGDLDNLPSAPPGSDQEYRGMARAISGAGRRDAKAEARIARRLRGIAETTLCMAWADQRSAASAAEARDGLADVARNFDHLRRSVDAMPEPVRAHLLGRLQMSSAWNPTGFKRDVAVVACWVQAEALDGDGGTAHGRGTLRKRLFGDAIDYLGNEIISLLQTERPDYMIGRGTLFHDILAETWAAATGRGSEDIPELAARIDRQIDAESLRREAREHERQAHHQSAAGLPGAAQKAAADQRHAEAMRARRGRESRKSQRRAETP